METDIKIAIYDIVYNWDECMATRGLISCILNSPDPPNSLILPVQPVEIASVCLAGFCSEPPFSGFGGPYTTRSY